MPLVRVQVRNEYGLGEAELYREANREDPKAVVDGVAVAGLVGILRQLGDLTEFAAEVFHGLQEQVMSTSSRSHKMVVRVQRIEDALAPLEKVILAQKSHLHFAYTAGYNWHSHLQNAQNHFIYGDLPNFIMDSYEECSDPPRLQLLDKFDTGGPGSCLKRYSDPTFFRRASANSREANVEKVLKDRKACRSKTKRTWQRNEVSHGASTPNHSDRAQFGSLKVNKQISPQTISTFNATLKSDLRDQSNYFDARTRSGHIEHEPKESSFSSSRMHQTVDSAFVGERNRVVDDDIPSSLLKEQTGPSSSCVTWDEKTEKVESTSHQYDRDPTAEIITMNFNGISQEKGAVNLINIDQMDFQFDNEDAETSISGQNQLHDIESEPDNYVDARNTIESESEADLDSQTKQDVERSSNISDDRTQYGMHGCSVHDLDLQPSNLESQTATYSSSNKMTSFDKPNSISLESYAYEESPQMTGESSNTGNSLGVDFCGKHNLLKGSNVESDVISLPYVSAEPSPQAPVSDKTISTSCEAQKSPNEPSVVHSVNCWTNGSLLGLEPSKPPDFNILNAVNQESVTKSKDDTASLSSQSNSLNGDVGKPDKLVQSSKSIEQSSAKCSTSCHNDRDGMHDKKTSWRFLPTDLDAKHEKYGDSDPSNSFNDNRGSSLSETSTVIPGTGQAALPGVKAISTEASQRDGENASQMFGLSSRILANGFQRNVSLVHDEKSEPSSSKKTDVFEQKSQNRSVAYRTFSERTFKGYFANRSPLNSPSSSPPLQPMKISFQPMNGFETKLKLKFPDGSYSHDSSRDMLPSFQLVPDPASPQHDIGSDSDDDTFSRSSRYMSDDCVSHHSESNSDQWESDYTPPRKDNELYQALCRISSIESVSSSLELEGTGRGSIDVDYGLQSPYAENCLEPCLSGRSLDLPSLSTLNPLFEQEIKISSDAKDLPELHFPMEPTPPPLPPLRWRVMKILSDVTISKQGSISDALNHAFDRKISQSIPSLMKQQQNTNEAIAFTPKSKPQWQKSNGQKEVNQAVNGQGIDEMEDFLHQIRTKSFSLRRTKTEKPTVTPGPTSSIEVTAILKKANAIRQADGSDDGEDDDNWSDI